MITLNFNTCNCQIKLAFSILEVTQNLTILGINSFRVFIFTFSSYTCIHIVVINDEFLYSSIKSYYISTITFIYKDVHILMCYN